MDYSCLFGCGIGSFPLKYLGIPMTHRRLRNSEWQCVIDRFEKRLAMWKGKLLSSGGRLVLINSVLSSLPIFMMSFFEVPIGVLKKLDAIRSRFYWQNGQFKKKYRLAKWNIICQPKEVGGLGVANLATKNICLLSKWLFKLLNQDGTWQQLLKNKYLGSKSLTQAVRKSGDSHFWAGLMNIKEEFLRWGRFRVGDGHATRFWDDRWILDRPLKVIYPNLFNIVRKRKALVKDVMNGNLPNLSFRRAIVGVKRVEWHNLSTLLASIPLGHSKDKFLWGPHRNGVFSVQSMYRLLMNTPTLTHNMLLWKLKIPLKIKIFLWYLGRGVILTKENLAKRGWTGSMKCCFCNQNETIQHIFFDCYLIRNIWRIIYFAFNIERPININHIIENWATNKGIAHRKKLLIGVAAMFWSIWLCRNDVAFNFKPIPSILQVLFRGMYWLRLWRLLQKQEAHQEILVVCQSLEMVAMEILAKHGWSSNARLKDA